MSLGAALPRGFLEAQIRRQLQPGVVIKMRQVMDDGAVHEKRFLVVSVDELTATCVINTAVSRFLKNQPALLKCQVHMPVAEHDFMDHDSHIDCSRMRSYSTTGVVEELISQPNWVLGAISANMRAAVLSAIKFAPTLSAKEVAKYCNSLGHAE